MKNIFEIFSNKYSYTDFKKDINIINNLTSLEMYDSPNIKRLNRFIHSGETIDYITIDEKIDFISIISNIRRLFPVNTYDYRDRENISKILLNRASRDDKEVIMDNILNGNFVNIYTLFSDTLIAIFEDKDFLNNIDISKYFHKMDNNLRLLYLNNIIKYDIDNIDEQIKNIDNRTKMVMLNELLSPKYLTNINSDKVALDIIIENSDFNNFMEVNNILYRLDNDIENLKYFINPILDKISRDGGQYEELVKERYPRLHNIYMNNYTINR